MDELLRWSGIIVQCYELAREFAGEQSTRVQYSKLRCRLQFFGALTDPTCAFSLVSTFYDHCT
jgi:hypothetical protein